MTLSPEVRNGVGFAFLDARVRAAVQRAASGDPDPADPLRGLYISDEQALALAAGEREADVDARISDAAKRLRLDALDVAVLGLCAAPEIHPHYGRLFSYLHDDVTRRLASPRLVAELLAGDGVAREDVLATFARTAPLRARGAIQVLDDTTPPTPLADRAVKVADRLAGFIVGLPAEPKDGGRLRRVDAAGEVAGRQEVVAEIGRMLRSGTRLPLVVAGPDAAALVAAAVETIPIRLDDNLSVAAAAGATLWTASWFDAAAIAAARDHVAAQLPIAIAVNAAVSFAGYRAKTVSGSGAIAGALIGTIIFATTGWRGWTLLFITFLAVATTSRLGLRRKTLLGIAEERGGRRGAGNAIANTGAAAVASILAVAGPFEAARLAFAAALVAGGSDTIASEIGKAWGRRTYSVTTLQRVPAGTSGAMSIEGTAAGLVGALALATIAAALGFAAGGASIVLIVAAATAASLIESGLGATLESPGILNNDALNFINTSAAALIAVAVHAWTS